MKILKSNDFSIQYLDEADEIEIAPKYKYIISRIAPENIERRILLENKGFSFHERVLGLEIDLGSTLERRDQLLKSNLLISFEQSSTYNKQMLRLAHEAYDTDRRFHLDKQFNLKLSKQVLRMYTNDFKNKKLLITQALYQKEVVGYTVIIEDDSVRAENVLGVTKPCITGKVAAYPLYIETLNTLQEKGYKKYYGVVSTTNEASLNLHFQLGAKVVDIIDEYIYRW